MPRRQQQLHRMKLRTTDPRLLLRCTLNAIRKQHFRIQHASLSVESLLLVFINKVL